MSVNFNPFRCICPSCRCGCNNRDDRREDRERRDYRRENRERRDCRRENRECRERDNRQRY